MIHNTKIPLDAITPIGFPGTTTTTTRIFQGRFFASHIPKVFKDKVLGARRFQQRAFEIHIDHDHLCRFYIVSPGVTGRSDAFFLEAVRKVYVWLSVCNHFAPAECSREMNVYLYLLDDKKVLPSNKSGHLGVEEVNTAFTMSGCQENSEINIYREEEWFKVLIHETFHNHGLDFSIHFDAYNTLVQGELQRCFPGLRSQVLLFESYCEFWAETLHTLFLAAANGVSIKAAWKTAQELFLQERQFSALQCVKVLDHYGLKYLDLFKPSGKGFSEDQSNVFAYHVIKYLMIEADFLSWHLAVNGPTLRFSDDYVLGFCKWIFKNRHVPNLLNMERLYAALDKRAPLAQTLRMVANG